MSEGEADDNGEHNPFVIVPPRGVGRGRSYWVAVPCFAVDVRSRMGDDRIVASQDDWRILGQQRDEMPGQDAGELDHRLAGLRENAAVAGGMTWCERSGCAEEIGDGASTAGEDRSAEQYQEAAIGGLGAKTGAKVSSKTRDSSGRMVMGPPSVGSPRKSLQFLMLPSRWSQKLHKSS
jgi:hypothetical protein